MPRSDDSTFERRLEAELAQWGYLLEAVVWTNNRVKLVSARTRRKKTHLRIARSLLVLGERAVEPIVGLVRGQKRAKAALQGLFAELPAAPPVRRRSVLKPQGDAVDLRGLVAFPCSLLEMDANDIQITWGARRRPGRRQRTFRLGSYDPGTDVVRLHRILDHPDVPHWYIEFVIFHELVHRHIGLTIGKDAARMHDARFREIEARFPRLAQARAWERSELMRHARRARRAMTS